VYIAGLSNGWKFAREKGGEEEVKLVTVSCLKEGKERGYTYELTFRVAFQRKLVFYT
jgi:hypothetical protein